MFASPSVSFYFSLSCSFLSGPIPSQRWVVLAQDAQLLTFKDENDLGSPTESIDLRV